MSDTHEHFVDTLEGGLRGRSFKAVFVFCGVMLLLLVPAGVVISMEWGDKAAGLCVAAGAAFLAVGGQLAVFLRERRSESMTVHQTAYIPAIVFSQGAGNAVVIGDSKTGHKLVVTSESKPTLTDIREQSMRRSKTLKILGWLSFI